MAQETAGLPPLIVDADPWLRRFRLPYWALARLRAMRVGDTLLLTEFEAPGLADGTGVAGVCVTRLRGSFQMESVWTAHLGKNALRRGHLWWSVSFKVLAGRRLALLQPEPWEGDFRLAGLRQAAVVLRRSRMLARWAAAAGDSRAAAALEPLNFMTRHDIETDALRWLEGLRGPAVPSAGVELASE